VCAAVAWAHAKIEEGSGFTVLAVLEKADGGRLTYNFMTDPSEHFAKIEQEIKRLEDVCAYALASDASAFANGEPRRCIACRIEEARMVQACEFLSFYTFKDPSTGFGSAIERAEAIYFFRDVDSWLSGPRC
jgi:hypothetical protein